MIPQQEYDLKLSFKRRTVSISISPDCSVKVLAPRFLSRKKIDEIVNEKSDWIKEKLEFFAQKKISHEKKIRKYVDGESFYYLGSELFLKILPSKKNRIEIDENNLILWLKDDTKTKIILEKFFAQNAKIILFQRMEICHKIFHEIHNCKLPSLTVRKMKSRYGSMHAGKNKMTLNEALIHCPVSLIDYVIFHEFCHVKYQDHSKRFYNLFTQILPDWKVRRSKLRDFFDQNLL